MHSETVKFIAYNFITHISQTYTRPQAAATESRYCDNRTSARRVNQTYCLLKQAVWGTRNETHANM